MRSSIWNKFTITALITILLFTGCKSKAEPQRPGDFFPMSKGSYWNYEGKGNEFASFSREVVFAEDGRAQIREDNGGTVMALILETTDHALTRVFSQAEAYGNENYLNRQATESTILIQGPIEVGTKWEFQEGSREITDIKAIVQTPAGEFTDCLAITTQVGESTLIDFYHAKVGLVKREFKSGDALVTSLLKNYTIEPTNK